MENETIDELIQSLKKIEDKSLTLRDVILSHYESCINDAMKEAKENLKFNYDETNEKIREIVAQIKSA